MKYKKYIIKQIDNIFRNLNLNVGVIFTTILKDVDFCLLF